MSVIVQELTKEFGTQKVVDQISFQVEKGTILGFLGPNGAGKTTTMKIISCFLPQSSGQASVCGYDVATHPMEVRKCIGYLPENNPLYKDMFVKEYLEFVGRLHQVKQLNGKVEEMIEKTGLQRERKKPIAALSKGYRQRVGLAQAMIHDPQVLILDEPTSGLDPNQLLEIRSLIKELGKEKTVIFSTHIMQEVQAICDRVLIINKGKLVADDSMEALQQKISGRQSIIVLFDREVTAQALTTIKGVAEVKALDSNKWQLFSDNDIRAAVFDFAVEQQRKLLEIYPESSTVEDVFQKLTRN